MPLAKLFGGDIHYEINGHPIRSQSTPVIILKPLSRGPVGVQPFINLLTTNFTVINYDQRGLGQKPTSFDFWTSIYERTRDRNF